MAGMKKTATKTGDHLERATDHFNTNGHVIPNTSASRMNNQAIKTETGRGWKQLKPHRNARAPRLESSGPSRRLDGPCTLGRLDDDRGARAKISSPNRFWRKFLFESGSKECINIEVFDAVFSVHVMLRPSLAQGQRNKAIYVLSCDLCACDLTFSTSWAISLRCARSSSVSRSKDRSLSIWKV